MLARNTGTYYGTPMQAYLDALVHDRAKDATALLTRLRSGRSRFLTKYLPKGADGQVRSVAARFALIASAGELARSYDILPWPQGEAWNALGACFKAWLAERGGADAGEELVARQTVEAFLAAHGAARFVRLIDRNGTLEVERPEQQVRDRAGFVRPAKHGGDGHEFLIFSATWTKDVCQGLDPKVVAATGVKQGWLIPDNNGKSSRPERVPGHALMRYYVVRETVISGATAGP